MFSLNLPQHNSPRRRLARRVLAGLLGLAAVFLVLGCPNLDGSGGGDGSTLSGTWTLHYSGDGYDFTTTIKIDDATKTYEYGDDMGGSYSAWYKGTIENLPSYAAAKGVLIVKFTEYPDSTKTGKYGAVYWNKLTAHSVSIADAYIGEVHALFDTLALAKAAFTVDRMSSYIDWSITTPYAK